MTYIEHLGPQLPTAASADSFGSTSAAAHGTASDSTWIAVVVGWKLPRLIWVATQIFVARWAPDAVINGVN